MPESKKEHPSWPEEAEKISKQRELYMALRHDYAFRLFLQISRVVQSPWKNLRSVALTGMACLVRVGSSSLDKDTSFCRLVLGLASCSFPFFPSLFDDRYWIIDIGKSKRICCRSDGSFRTQRIRTQVSELVPTTTTAWFD